MVRCGKHDLRYARARQLAASAMEVMVTDAGNLRHRMLLIDQEFFMLSGDQLPNRDRLREDHSELRGRVTRLTARGEEGTIAATIGRAQFHTLEQDASLLLSVCKRLLACGTE